MKTRRRSTPNGWETKSAIPTLVQRLPEDFQGSRIASDGGLIPVRELDERLGFGGRFGERFGSH